MKPVVLKVAPLKAPVNISIEVEAQSQPEDITPLQLQTMEVVTEETMPTPEAQKEWSSLNLRLKRNLLAKLKM